MKVQNCVKKIIPSLRKHGNKMPTEGVSLKMIVEEAKFLPNVSTTGGISLILHF